MSVEITIKHALKKYGQTAVIPDLSFNIKNGELFTLLGPSGCGKTTLLRMIAGFNSIEGGTFFFNDRIINDMEPGKRNIGMVFQNYAIFPNMTVRKNVEFGLKYRKLSKEEMRTETDRFLKLVHVDQYADRMPERLSGGQQQRVALARALVIRPDVLLMDEPLSNLDAKLRIEMRNIIRNIQREVGITTVYVTHDQEEAMAISDRVAVMKDGVIRHCGRPQNIYQRPADLFVATFIGKSNLLSAELISDSHTEEAGSSDSVTVGAADGTANGAANRTENRTANEAANEAASRAAGGKICWLRFKNGYRLPFSSVKSEEIRNRPVTVSARPEELLVHASEEEAGCRGIRAVVKDSIFLGLNTHYFVELETGESAEIIQESRIDSIIPPGSNVVLTLNADKANLFDPDTTRSLMQGVESSVELPDTAAGEEVD